MLSCSFQILLKTVGYVIIWTYHKDLKGLLAEIQSTFKQSQHDELEPNLKKILHSNELCGLEAIVM